ncbi:MAG: ECF-type sigma factor [Myxococcota bacterium]
MVADARSEVTAILERLGSPASGASPDADHARLLELTYAELRRLARGLMSRERRAVTLQPTALVHEAYVRLVKQRAPEWSGRAHFLAVAATCMRNVLVDHARARRALRRGGPLQPVTLDEQLVGTPSAELETLLVHDALERFAELDPRAARVAELRLFGGMSVPEVATVLDVSPRTVDGDWASARLWLSRALRDDS